MNEAPNHPVTAETHNHRPGDFVGVDFFDKVTSRWFENPLPTKEWEYEMRRQAQMILPFLYLGPSSSVKNVDFLQANGITLLLAVRTKNYAQAKLVSGQDTAERLNIEHDSIDVLDDQELVASCPRAIRRINDHISSPEGAKIDTWPPKKVFVFCESGNDRSALIVVAYVMTMLNLPFQQALHMVQHRRFSLCFGMKMRTLLASYQAVLEAKQDVERCRRDAAEQAITTSPHLLASKKRNHESVRCNEAADDEMDIDDDWDSAADRRPASPFKDRE